MAKHYPVEQRKRAVKMVLDHLGEYRSVYAACQTIGPKVGVDFLDDHARYALSITAHRRVVGAIVLTESAKPLNAMVSQTHTPRSQPNEGSELFRCPETSQRADDGNRTRVFSLGS